MFSTFVCIVTSFSLLLHYMKNIPQLLIAAPASASGKTTLARGLMALLSSQQLRVQPFKCGPDYIDTKFHTQVCGRPSVNLDIFMAGADHLQCVYAHYAQGADVCVIEGMMGLFDGYDRDLGSSAQVASTLHLPVVLVVDARSAAYSLAPLLKGFLDFRPNLRIVGVVFNKVASERHCAMLRQVCDDLRLTCFGWLPKSDDAAMSSRYLGLDFSRQADTDDRLVDLIRQHIDWQRLLQFTTAPLPAASALFERSAQCHHISIAHNDESFSFVYQEHIDMLRSLGKVSFFNPEANEPLPTSTDLLYLPGGYPERHVDALAGATHTRESILAYARNGGRILAECGGMMYLCRSIVDDNGRHPMCGVLPYDIGARKADRRLSLGYRQFTLQGQACRGHEFHYTQFLPPLPESAVLVTDARGTAAATPVIKTNNVIASYTHLYWGNRSPLSLF